MKRLLPFLAILALAGCGGQQSAEAPPTPVAAAPSAPVVKVATLEDLPAPLPNPYDDKADAKADIDKAFAAAQVSGKRVLVNYGGNWCSWCRGLEGVMLLPEVKPFIDANFEVVHVSTGAIPTLMNSRPETYKPFGVEKIDGTPFLVIAEPDRTVVHKGSEVTDEAHETPQAMVNWLAQFAQTGFVAVEAPLKPGKVTFVDGKPVTSTQTGGSNEMPICKVNGREVEFEPGMTVLQVAEMAGEEIPRFCYHERLSIAGNCRMCLVEVKPGPPKPQASCALPAAEGQEITTNSPMVEKARKGVMEFLLINHPLDCPICDQGGECDLQDQAMGYGRDDTRYQENKRAVEEKYMGPVIKTAMTRCIQCTRCVRFITEVAGIPEIGLISRGEDVEITTYLESAVTSELSGNVNDLCPVGALTHKPWAFNYRPWELVKTDSIDVMDALGSAIRIDARGNEVMRILPRINEDINEEWLSDKSRYACDGLLRQRLDKPYIRRNGKLQPATWGEALALVAEKITETKPERIGVIAGDLQDAESMKAALDLFRGKLGVQSLDCRQDGSRIGEGPREGWLFNSTIAGIDEADAILLVGTNPRIEAPVLNARIRRAWATRGAHIGLVGDAHDLTYGYERIGETASSLAGLSKSRKGFAEQLRAAKNPMVIVGAGASADAFAQSAKTAQAFNASFNVLHTAAARVGGLDLGFIPGSTGRSVVDLVSRQGADLLFLLGADELDLSQTTAFVVYLGTHGDAGAHRADVILPAAAYTEKDGLYVNTEGRVQRGARAVFPKGEAKEDWAIIRALSELLGQTLPYNTHAELRAALFADHPTFAGLDFAPGGKADLSAIKAWGAPSGGPLTARTTDFYMTNPVARASVTMAELSALKSGASKMAAE